MKNSNSQEEIIQEKETLTYSEELIAITSVINNFVGALNNQNWVKVKKYCLPGSQVDLKVDESKNSLAEYFTSDTKLITNY